MDSSLKAHLSLFSAQVIYALNYSIAKGLMPDHIGPFALVFCRIAGACLLFWSISLLTPAEKLEKGDLRKMALLAVFGVAVNQIFFIWGLDNTQPINSAIIMISNPIVVVVFTMIVLKEKITIYKVSGLSLGILGAVSLLLFKSKGGLSFGSDTITGDLMTLVNSFSWAVFVVMAKPYMIKYKTVTVMKWIFLFGLLYVTPVGMYDFMNTGWHTFNSDTWFALSFVVIATTFLAYLLNTYALKALSPSVVSTYIYLQPFLATIFAVYFGKDELTPVKIIAAACIMSGVYLVSKKTKAV